MPPENNHTNANGSDVYKPKNGKDAGVWLLVMEDTGAFSPQKDLSHPWRARKQGARLR